MYSPPSDTWYEVRCIKFIKFKCWVVVIYHVRTKFFLKILLSDLQILIFIPLLMSRMNFSSQSLLYFVEGPCLNEGICHDDINFYMCECPDGFSGLNCDVNLMIVPLILA